MEIDVTFCCAEHPRGASELAGVTAETPHMEMWSASEHERRAKVKKQRKGGEVERWKK